MPVNVVTTPEQEIAWERAKDRAREESQTRAAIASIGL